MTLIEDVQTICKRLETHGWKELLLTHGLDITSSNLRQELENELTIDRNVPGFEDFSFEGKRGIEPGAPSQSLLFHALASPNVIYGVDGKELSSFPTLHEIEVVENYVYGVKPPSILELRRKAEHSLLAIAVFAHEYRPAAETVHQKYADQCFSRTGVARVGTNPIQYNPKIRGFLPFVENDLNAIRVLPAKYSTFIAVQMKGDFNRFGPMRFKQGDINSNDGNSNLDDAKLNFWVPIHKLFNGSECIRGLDLHIEFNSYHVNEKIRRTHIELARRGNDTGWKDPDINESPFTFSDGIVSLVNDDYLGSGVVVPIHHKPLVEAAIYQGKELTFKVPLNGPTLSSSVEIPVDEENDNFRHAPEYVHARTKVENGNHIDLNDEDDVRNIVKGGDYEALHYIDFTGDGWVKSLCPELSNSIPRNIPAYSLITAPDFFPNTDQRELMDWYDQVVPSHLKENLWRIPPETLSDDRIAPNLQLKDADFRPEDKTVTTIVSSLKSDNMIMDTSLSSSKTNRHSYLPDAASGLFAPGWDISHDRTTAGEEHLAAYGLGSPFPEDSKLCAALSTFWPAVAPDAARTFQPMPNWPSVSPLTDEEIGITGDNPWDGMIGPKYIEQDNTIEYTEFDHADYTFNALHNKFSLSFTGRVDITEYQSRVLSMARVYRVLNSTSIPQRSSWGIISFTNIFPGSNELISAENQTGTSLSIPIYKFEMFKHGERIRHPTHNPKKIRVSIIGEKITLIVSPTLILVKRGNGPWEVNNE